MYEVFFRDGSYAIDFSFTRKHLKVIGGAMEAAGFGHVEVGHGYGLGAERAGYPAAAETDEVYLKTAAEVFKKASFGAYFIPGVGTLDDMARARDYGMGFISIGRNITEIEEVEETVSYAKNLGLQTTVCLMKAYAVGNEEFGKKVGIVQEWGPDYILIMDSAGNMLPTEIVGRVKLIQEKGDARPGFHGHDNLSLAAANSLVAARSGAVRIDTSMRGLGRSAGNAPTEVVTALFERAGIICEPGLSGLEPVIAALDAMKVDIPGKKDMTDILLGLYGLHSSVSRQLNKKADEYGIKRAELYREVAKHNSVSPSAEDIEEIAIRLKA